MARFTLILATAALAAMWAAPAQAAKRKPCNRGGAKLVMAEDGTRIVKRKLKSAGRYQTRREAFYACRVKTGKRVLIVTESDNGLDNVASSEFAITYGGRYAGVIATNTGGISESRRAMVFDVYKRKKVNDSRLCDDLEQGDFSGPVDVAFVGRGGIAYACGALYLHRNAGAAREDIEPATAEVWQVAVSEHSHFLSQRLFWTAGFDAPQTRSMQL